MVTHLDDLIRFRLPSNVDDQIWKTLIGILRTVSLRVKLSVQPIWRIFARTGQPALAVVLNALSGVHRFSSHFRKAVNKLGVDKRLLRPGLELLTDPDGTVFGMVDGKTFDVPNWTSDLSNRKYHRKSSRSLVDSAFRQKHQQDQQTGAMDTARLS